MNDDDKATIEELCGERDPGMVKGGPVAHGCGDPESPPALADAGKVAAALGEDARRWKAAGFTFDTDAGGLLPTSTSSIALRFHAPAVMTFRDGSVREVLSFHADGTIKVGEGVTADEAAAAVVEALRPRFAEMIRQERAALDQRALISLAAELKRRAEIRQGDPSGEDAARLRAAARIVEGVATGAPTEATVCPLRACSEPHVHGPTGERHNAFDEGARAVPIDAEDLWTDWRTEREHVGAADRLAFLAGVDAGRRTRPAPLTEGEAEAWGAAIAVQRWSFDLAHQIECALLSASRGEIPADARPQASGCADGCGAAEHAHCWNASSWTLAAKEDLAAALSDPATAEGAAALLDIGAFQGGKLDTDERARHAALAAKKKPQVKYPRHGCRDGHRDDCNGPDHSPIKMGETCSCPCHEPQPSEPACRVCDRPIADHGPDPGNGTDRGIPGECDGYEASAAPTTSSPLSAFERLEAAIAELRAWQANDDNAAPIDGICEVVDAFDAFTTAREAAPVEPHAVRQAMSLLHETLGHVLPKIDAEERKSLAARWKYLQLKVGEVIALSRL